MEQQVEEIKQLKACLNDLVSVLALPAIWTGREPSQIIRTLLDSLLSMLRLDFAYARVGDSAGAPIEMVRLAPGGNSAVEPSSVGAILECSLTGHASESSLRIRNPIGEGEVSIALLPLRFQDKSEHLVAASQRADFPSKTERLLLQVAANQASIGLEEARRMSEQRRVAEELDRRVTQRTKELTAVNEELRNENVERKRAETLLTGEKRLLEMIAAGNSLSVILDGLCRFVEGLSKDSLCSILLLDPDSNRLCHGAAPSLPKSYTEAIDGASIGPAAGSCGTAAYRKEAVIVSDIAHDPLWADYRDLALPHGLRACWSTPIVASDRTVLGTFAIYSREPKAPTPQQLNITEQISNLASIAIERKQAEDYRHAHLSLLESMNQVNRAIQGTNDLEQMMSNVLDVTLSIFNCDRAWLVYSSDPRALTWKVPMEHTRPEFPGAYALGRELPMSPDAAEVFRAVRASHTPVRFGPAAKFPLPPETAKRFSIQSMIAMAVYPKGDEPYILGLHQCSYPRVWTAQEERLFQEIGRRLEDALTSVLIFRNLRESERKLEEAQRLAHVGYWDRDLEADRITWSEETYRMFGLPVGETINYDRVRRLIHPEDLPAVLEAVGAALRNGRGYDVEFRVLRPDGELRIIHSQADVTRDQSGRPRRMFGTVQDITERKRVENRLRTQHSVTRILAEAATIEEATPNILRAIGECLEWDVGALWRVDRDAGVLRCVEFWHKASMQVAEFESVTRNTAFPRGLGLPGKVWLNAAPRYISDLLNHANFQRTPVAEREGLHAAFGFPILLGGEVLGIIEFFSCEIREPDQDLLHMLTTIGSQIGQFIERRRAQQALLDVQAELTHVTRVSTLGELTASIAHEINQPLGAIVNNASACLRWLAAQNVEAARSSAALIIDDGHRAGEIIRRIRSFAQKAPPQKDCIDIDETIREVIALARNEIQRNGVALEIHLANHNQHTPEIFADRIQLQQVLLNLIMNAVEAMREVSDGPRMLLIRTGADASENIVVAVRDTGPGLAPENIERLFTPFYTTKPQGMGMGLAICRSIIDAHGGTLWATANEDRGATFHFTLPTRRVKGS